MFEVVELLVGLNVFKYLLIIRFFMFITYILLAHMYDIRNLVLVPRREVVMFVVVPSYSALDAEGVDFVLDMRDVLDEEEEREDTHDTMYHF